jgi:curved DNA-binding protein CbpA
MDPYQTLGVSRSCTREEVKEVFRIRAWYAHPDRGGDDETFIRLCSAYKQILDELDRRPKPRPAEPARAPRPAGPTVPPDPNWKPDMILDEQVRPVRWPPKPSDPNWNADLVLLEETSPESRLPTPPNTMAARRRYVSWLRLVADKSARDRSVWRSDWVGTLGTLLILVTIISSIWGCWIAWNYAAKQAEQAARRSW